MNLRPNYATKYNFVITTNLGLVYNEAAVAFISLNNEPGRIRLHKLAVLKPLDGRLRLCVDHSLEFDMVPSVAGHAH